MRAKTQTFHHKNKDVRERVRACEVLLFQNRLCKQLKCLLDDDPEKPGGFAEFRGTYGGLFLASHGVALTFVVKALAAGTPAPVSNESVLWFAEIAGLTCGAMWIGTGMGRLLSILLDGTGTKFNQASVAIELGLGLAIAAPCAFH